MSLLAAVIEVTTVRERLPWLGRAAQAWLLGKVRDVDPGLAALLHGGQGRRPYTVSVMPGNEGLHWLRVTSVSAELSGVLRQNILPQLEAGQTIRLANIELKIGRILTENHPWAGQSDLERLAQDAFEPNKVLPMPGFEFATATAFHSGGLAVPLPVPSFVFGSLINAWETFSPVALPVQVGDFVEQYVAVARHRIATRIVGFGEKERHVGFVGTANFAILPLEKTNRTADEYRQRVQAITLLTQFAFYVGVGIRTAVGMGQVRPIEV
jgi:CRISPR-associated endoribonuclease Cas6